MSGSQDDQFKQSLKELILEETGKDELSPEQIADDEALFGPDTSLELDSLDGLQVSVALKQQFGVELNDSKRLRRVMANINTLADFLRPD
ncbi:acyl carrier protein [Natronospira proteinivora]|uniref:Acyl carrier protein n=1 Tax=Natronospira proteinivora TaxID=1807133 RepID=A0ABT1G8V7_9GAMM|nr:phosphopantetheine-binding protein [Natronospira proteinivora]MCP1727734.1 acyl carrier protein [Natronospira proteinivora]